ncbi:MAG: DegT/DnrJ/EryC1/StrS aminotransferase family protein [Candidatus Omnitrophica bacterium]|nr:DegT/DnrJ/EryC1/StrS aminotransferase family protein [Candidatus Omnitrophota bacterium]
MTKRPLPHSRPTLDDRDIAAVSKALSSGQVSMGPAVAAFEDRFARKLGVRQAAAVSSGTAALHLSLLALGVGKSDDVIIPTHVCTALLNAVNYVGARPVLADVDYADGNISAADVKKKLTRRTRAIIVPHLWGEPADLGALLKLGVPVVEDCAQATGALYKGKPVGTLGRIGVFSFYATKMLTTGEGGMVVANDQRLMKAVRDRLSYDHREDWQVRFNYKLSDLQAALGSSQLDRLDQFIERRRNLAAIYGEGLKGTGVTLPQGRAGSAGVAYRFVIKVGNAASFIKRAQAAGIQCERPLFRPLHRYLGLKGFPVSERLMQESVSVPIYPSLKDSDARSISRELRKLFDKPQARP